MKAEEYYPFLADSVSSSGLDSPTQMATRSICSGSQCNTMPWGHTRAIETGELRLGGEHPPVPSFCRTLLSALAD